MKLVEAIDIPIPPMDAARVLFSEGDRAPGLHVTDVIHDMHSTVFGARHRPSKVVHTSPRKFAENWAFIEPGFVWEEMMWHPYFRDRMIVRRKKQIAAAKRKVRDALVVQPTYERDGIHMTLDTISTLGDPWVLDEYKATTRSVRNWEENAEKEFWRWFYQIRAYLHAAQLTICDLYVLWQVGDWRGSGALMRKYRLEFSPKELRDSWQRILRHVESRGLRERYRT